MFSNLGADTVNGGDGNDDLWSLARGDVPNPGVDTLTGGNGNDRFHVRDGEADVVTCGAGNDTVLADTVDVISDATPENINGSCERVVRSTIPDNAGPENATQAPKEDSKQS